MDSVVDLPGGMSTLKTHFWRSGRRTCRRLVGSPAVQGRPRGLGIGGFATSGLCQRDTGVLISCCRSSSRMIRKFVGAAPAPYPPPAGGSRPDPLPQASPPLDSTRKRRQHCPTAPDPPSLRWNRQVRPSGERSQRHLPAADFVVALARGTMEKTRAGIRMTATSKSKVHAGPGRDGSNGRVWRNPLLTVSTASAPQPSCCFRFKLPLSPLQPPCREGLA